MKKHFLLALLALFPLFALAGSVTVTQTKTEALSTEQVTFADLVSVTTSNQGNGWYSWVNGSNFTYRAYKIVNGQISSTASYSGAGTAVAPNQDGTYMITVSRLYYPSRSDAYWGDFVQGTWDVGFYTVTTPAQTDNTGGIDVNAIKGKLQVNALSQRKYWGQLDPEPRINITNGYNRIVSSEAIGLDESTVKMFRADGEEPGGYAWNVDLTEVVYDESPDYFLAAGTGDFLIIKKVPVNEATGLITIA